MRVLIDFDNTLVDGAGAFRRWSDQAVISERLGTSKPDPAAFLAAMGGARPEALDALRW